MPATSGIPAALDALVIALRAALTGVVVVDGPPIDWEPLQLPAGMAAVGNELRYLFIGASPSGAGVEGEQDFNAAGAVSRDETFRVSCTAYAVGGAGAKARRDEAFAIVAAAETSLKTDPSLAGAVLYSLVSAVSAVDQRSRNGEWSDCSITFTITCRGYLS